MPQRRRRGPAAEASGARSGGVGGRSAASRLLAQRTRVVGKRLDLNDQLVDGIGLPSPEFGRSRRRRAPAAA